MTVDRDPRDLDTLDRIQRRLLWLAVRMVDHANRERVAPVGDMAIKVGGHQASSASMVSIMTALWFGHLRSDDKVAVKPHASPVYHSIKYLTGELDRSYLTRLREVGGLQAYPSRTKDPDVADFSTGSVGLGAVAPLFAAMTRPLRRRPLRTGWADVIRPGSSRSSAMPSSTRATSGKRSPTRRCRVSGR